MRELTLGWLYFGASSSACYEGVEVGAGSISRLAIFWGQDKCA